MTATEEIRAMEQAAVMESFRNILLERIYGAAENGLTARDIRNAFCRYSEDQICETLKEFYDQGLIVLKRVNPSKPGIRRVAWVKSEVA